MAFTPSLIGLTHGDNISSLVITTPNVAAGNQIYAFLAVTVTQLLSAPIDTAGNTYLLSGGTQPGPSIWLWHVANSLHLSSGNTITVQPASGTFSGTFAAISVSGLTSGAIKGTSSAFGFGTSVVVGLPPVTSGDDVLGVVAVNGPSSDGFIQDPAFLSPGNINNQTTSDFAAYAGYKLGLSAGSVLYQPTLGVSRAWAALLIEFAP